MLTLQLLHDQQQAGVQCSITVNELAELLAPIGCGPLASRSPINYRVTLRWGFLNRVGRYRPVGSTSWSLVCWSCRHMEGYLIRRLDLILTVYGPTRRWPEGQLSPRAGSMSPSQSAINQGVGVSTPCGAVSTRGISVFVPGLL